MSRRNCFIVKWNMEQVLWPDHSGESEFQEKKKSKAGFILSHFASFFFCILILLLLTINILWFYSILFYYETKNNPIYTVGLLQELLIILWQLLAKYLEVGFGAAVRRLVKGFDLSKNMLQIICWNVLEAPAPLPLTWTRTEALLFQLPFPCQIQQIMTRCFVNSILELS